VGIKQQHGKVLRDRNWWLVAKSNVIGLGLYERPASLLDSQAAVRLARQTILFEASVIRMCSNHLYKIVEMTVHSLK
jgi:hypothetical protein